MVIFPKLDFLRFCFEEHDIVQELCSDKIPYMDLTFCMNGKMHYIYEGENVYLSSGDAILFPQGSVRTRLETNGYALYCSFNIAFPEGFEPAVKGYLPNSIRSDTVRIVESVKNSFKSVSDEKNEKCTSLFWYLYYQLVESAENNENPHIKNIKHYIAKHLGENISLASISEYVHLTPQYCCSLFAKHTGQTLFDFISCRKIEYAKSLIVTTNLKLTEIAEMCGFGDYNYFSRMFKKIAGVCASKYRNSDK